MKAQEARAIKAQVEADDTRIRVRVIPAGPGFRLRLVLHTGTCNQRVVLVGKKRDVDLIKSLWEGL